MVARRRQAPARPPDRRPHLHSPPLRRWLALLLLVLLPTQAAWAAMARYCVHETAAAGHVGHHEHAPHGHATAVADITADPAADSASPMPAHDCADCHGSHAGLVGLGTALAGAPRASRLRGRVHRPAPDTPPPSPTAPSGRPSPDRRGGFALPLSPRAPDRCPGSGPGPARPRRVAARRSPVSRPQHWSIGCTRAHESRSACGRPCWPPPAPPPRPRARRPPRRPG